MVPPANLHDRDGGRRRRSALEERCPLLEKRFAAGADQGPVCPQARAHVRPQLKTAIVPRRDQVSGCGVCPTRWIVERTIAWRKRCRRLAQDFEHHPRTASAFVLLASIRLRLRKLCNPS